MTWLIGILIFAVAVFLTAYLLPGVEVRNFWTALIVALLLTLVNATIRPILSFLAFPITFLTLGLFALVINAFMVKIVDWIVGGFKVKSFLWAILFSIVLAIINAVLSWLIPYSS